MQNNFKEFKKLAREVHLSTDEKSAMREKLFHYTKAHPVVFNQPRSSPFFSMQSLRSRLKDRGTIPQRPRLYDLRGTIPQNRVMLSVLVSLGLVIGGSVSFAAESTLPGDFLYPVKVHLNENVRGTIAVTQAAKADWDVRLVERRLKETENLARIPETLPSIKEVAQENLEYYTKKTEERINRFENNKEYNSALVTSQHLTQTLKAHEKILEGIDTAQYKEKNFLRRDKSTNIEKIRDTRYRVEVRNKELENRYKLNFVSPAGRERSDSTGPSRLNDLHDVTPGVWPLLNDVHDTIPQNQKEDPISKEKAKKLDVETSISVEKKEEIQKSELRSTKHVDDDDIKKR